jgi:hypothetical protein
VSRLSLRVRLAALIGLMLALCGAVLLAISYGLVSSNLGAPLPSKPAVPASSARATSGTQRHTGKGEAGMPHVVRNPPSGPPARPANAAAIAAVGTKGAAQNALRKRTLDQLVTQYLASRPRRRCARRGRARLAAGRAAAALGPQDHPGGRARHRQEPQRADRPRRCRSSHRLFGAAAGHALVTGTGWGSQLCKRSLVHTRAR